MTLTHIKFYLFLLHIISAGAALHPCSTTTDYMDSSQNLFTHLYCRNEELSWCEGSTGGTLYQLPKMIDCPHYPNVSSDATALTTTPFFTDDDKILVGYFCYSRTYAVQIHRDLWFQDQLSQADMPFIKLAPEYCLKMSLRKVSPNGQKMIMLRDGLFGTNNHLKPEPHWNSTETEVNTNYFVVKIDLRVDHLTRHISAGTPTLNPCHVEQGFCDTEDGILMWDPPLHPMCSLKSKNFV
ncbi:hypothetical protein Fcan01_25869 [Folsomia candida]|uniref:Uncharacterized protein n=1 Tax=Folsomia candida TaxID=158441 RepID=A0A226D3T4_FOLCA|nr:hypothetical protein Fcan01_25869 [Folsomia candida]